MMVRGQSPLVNCLTGSCSCQRSHLDARYACNHGKPCRLNHRVRRPCSPFRVLSYNGLVFRLSSRSSVDGLDVRVWFTEDGQRAVIETKIRSALEQLALYSPRHLDDVRRYLRGVLVTAVPAIAQYNHRSRLCLLD